MLRLAVVVSVLSGCLNDQPGVGETEQEAGTYPWKQSSKWPFQVENARMIVHYQAAGDLAMAQSVLADVDHAWTTQVGQGGRPPLDDGAISGPDGRFDVWLQRGLDSLYVAAVAANPSTTWDDYSTSMVLDPWGKYGGAEMRANVFHEFRHASQATDDWYEHIWAFEAEATMWEALYFGYDRLSSAWVDYQAHPDWTPFRDDRYTTWFMYGGALFLIHLEKTVFANSPAFSNEMWLGSRNPANASDPDFADALSTMLAARGTTLFDQVVAFNRSRWYTGARANGTLDGGASIADVATRAHTRSSGATRTSFIPNPQVLGTVFTVITAAPTDGSTLRISLSNIDAKAAPVVQVVGQGTSDRVLDLTTGSATVNVLAGKVVLAVTMLPSNGQFDPDAAGTQAYKATVNVDKI